MDEFEYGNTRIRAMRSKLLDWNELKKLSRSEDLDGLLSSLSTTSYHPDIEHALVTYIGQDCIMNAIKHNLSRTYARIRSFYSDTIRRTLLPLFWRSDIHNLKAIIRGVIHPFSGSNITETFLPGGEIDENTLTQLSLSDNIGEVIDHMLSQRLPFSRALLIARQTQNRSGSAFWESALEKYYFLESLKILEAKKSASHLMQEYIERLADETNLITLLKFLQVPQEREFFQEKMENTLVGGGKLSKETLLTISLQRSINDAAGFLQETPRAVVFQKAFDKYRFTHQVSEFEKEIRFDRQCWMAGLISRDPLGIGVPMGYAAFKDNEARNLRLITKFITLGFSSNEIIMNLENISINSNLRKVR